MLRNMITGSRFYFLIDNLYTTKCRNRTSLFIRDYMTSPFIPEVGPNDLQWIYCTHARKALSQQSLFKNVKVLQAVVHIGIRRDQQLYKFITLSFVYVNFRLESSEVGKNVVTQIINITKTALLQFNFNFRLNPSSKFKLWGCIFSSYQK